MYSVAQSEQSMAIYTQKHRPIAVTTPLSLDVLLLTGFTGPTAPPTGR